MSNELATYLSTMPYQLKRDLRQALGELHDTAFMNGFSAFIEPGEPEPLADPDVNRQRQRFLDDAILKLTVPIVEKVKGKKK